MIHFIKQGGLLAFFAIALFSCVTPTKLMLKKDVKIDVLGVNLLVNPTVSSYISSELQRELDDFMMAYNAENHSFRVKRTDDCTTSCLQLKVYDVQLVSPEKQTTGVLISLLGFSMPFVLASSNSPIIATFWYFPRAGSVSEVSLSNDINYNTASPIRKVISSPAFLKSPQKQVAKHCLHFNKLLQSMMNEVDAENAK
jgi:hypothetical protein